MDMGGKMTERGTYRCGRCETEYRVAGKGEPTVLCAECEQVASPYGDEMAHREYRLGHTKYLEARRQLTRAMDCFESNNLALARGGFNDAAAEFEAAVDHFTDAAKQAASEGCQERCEQARKKATCLWQAAEWLSGATYATEQGNETQASRYRDDASQRLRAAGEHGDITAPDTLVEQA